MAWTITENGKRLEVAIDGRFVAAVAPAARDEISSRMHDGMDVLFDLSKMAHIDSSGIGVLVQVLQKARAHGGRVALVGLQEGPRLVFEITKVNRVFDIVDKPEDAFGS